jgi:hypothetical protein
MIMCDIFMIAFLWNYEISVKVQYYNNLIGLPYLDNVALLYCVHDVIIA